MPEITVLMPVYNASEYLKEAIDSILNQTFTDFELLIINDGSTDNSIEIINSYTDPRIRLVNNERNLKLITTLNKGLALAKGKYIARMDSDDISQPRRLELQYKIMEENENIAICGTGLRRMGKPLSIPAMITSPKDVRNSLRVFDCLFHPTIMMRKSILEENHFSYDLNYLHAEDYHLFQLISEKFDVVNISEPLLKYRLSPGGISRVHEKEQRYMSDKISMEALARIGIYFDRHKYSELKLEKEKILEAKIEIEKIKESLQKNDEDIDEVLNWLWFEMCYRGTMHGNWALKTYLSSPVAQKNKIHRIMIMKFYLKSFLRR